jgi:hypothetical protein
MEKSSYQGIKVDYPNDVEFFGNNEFIHINRQNAYFNRQQTEN